MIQLIDTHTHIYGPEYDEDREEALERAKEAGVARLIAIGAGLESSRAALQLAIAHPNVIATVGVHPHEAKDFDEGQWAEIRAMADHPKVRAIGEIGLDYHYDFSPKGAQVFTFQSQMSLASGKEMPVVIHMREAEDEVYAALKSALSDNGPGERGSAGRVGPIVMHCFLGGPAEAERWLGLGCTLGIGGAVTFKKMDALREAVRLAPLDRILLETDCPYMTPHPHRGKRNESSYIPLVARTVAEVKGLSLEEVAAATTANADRIFGTW